jgi:transcriptional regulator with XRE-family HTH domain
VTRVTAASVTVQFDRVLGRRMKETRIAAGLSRRDLAARLGCAPITVRSWENATRRPMIIDVYRWAEACGVTSTAILDPALYPTKERP